MIRLLVADDERPARELLKSYLKGMEGIEIAGEAENGLQAIEAAEVLRPDLVLLDVQMPGMSGIQAAAALPEGTGIIFVTAFDSYAIKAFELHAFDYILKPAMKPRVRESVQRFAASRRGGDVAKAKALEEELVVLRRDEEKPSVARASAGYADRLTIRTMFEYMVVKVSDIACVRVEEGLVFIYAEGIKYAYGSSLKRLEEKLDPSVFIRVHRNALVNKNRVKRIVPYGSTQFKVEVEGGEAVEVSRDNLRGFKEAMGWDI